ncbi:RNA polymerase sigma factor [Nonomuraea angiospora]|uniref:RNA polymerase sigma-70 factor (ECF subfamily) n=1 Tax=Nonomuraea angiospora TaxID=46172 RepID=A0ABR9MG44_9ACTN|nr:RNA polymerase sigma factor [Nonomuraea angiospora]MBE1591565.1 RNA polymerase sigma-70 factor (ECF subfamily) [Nonomuraea angiospora]
MTDPPSPGGGHQPSVRGRAALVDCRDDSSIIEASLRTPECFAVLFDRHAAVLHRYAVRRLGPEHAEDVVAEAFTRAFETRDRYEFARTEALPWLYGITTNVIGLHRRAEVRGYRAMARTGEDPVVAAFDERVAARVSASATRQSLAAALAKLGRGERDVLLLIAWGDLTYEETAQALRVPIGTVRSRLSRARRKVAHALGGANPAETREEDHERP